MIAPASDGSREIRNLASVFREGETTPAASKEETTTVVSSGDYSDLSVSQTVSPDPVVAGGTLRYTLTVSNDGPGSSGAVLRACLSDAGVTI